MHTTRLTRGFDCVAMETTGYADGGSSLALASSIEQREPLSISFHISLNMADWGKYPFTSSRASNAKDSCFSASLDVCQYNPLLGLAQTTSLDSGHDFDWTSRTPSSLQKRPVRRGIKALLLIEWLCSIHQKEETGAGDPLRSATVVRSNVSK